MPPIQYILVIFAVFAVIRLIVQFRRGRVALGGLFVWLIVWGGMITVALLPQTTSTLARIVGVGRGADAIIYVSIAGLSYLVFRLYSKIEETERALTKVVRHLAIEEALKEKKPKI